jgi:hypothetical protein
MEIVKMSDLVKKSTINELGKPTGQKFMSVAYPYIIKGLNSYSIKYKAAQYPFVLEWSTNEYTIQLGINDDCKSLYLHGIEVIKKGHGLGTELMNKILDHCDNENINLKLCAFPVEYSKDPFKYGTKRILPKYFKLKDWYTSLGFKSLSSGEMEYVPQMCS